MNTLHELRATLDAHAESVHDDVAHVRSVSVRARARSVQRRRAVATGAAAALVISGIAVSISFGERDVQPAGRQLIGREAPETITSLGYTYDFVRGVESGDERASIQLRASDAPRLITWASDAERVVVDSPFDRVVAMGTGFDDFVLVWPEESGTWKIRAGGEDTAIAVYELSEERPPGVTVDGITFRDRIGDQELLDARIGAAGETDLTLEVTLPDSPLEISELCVGVPEGYAINYSENGRWTGGSRGAGGIDPCGDEPTFDPGEGGSTTHHDMGDLGRPGETVRIRTWVSKELEGKPVQLEGVRLGLAAYALAPPATTIAGWGVEEVIEHDGHRWRYIDAVKTSPGKDRLVLDRNFNEPTLMFTHILGMTEGRGIVREGAGPDAMTSYGGGASSSGPMVLGPGRVRYPIVVKRGLTDRTVLGMSLYERAD